MQLRAVKKISNGQEGHQFLRQIEHKDKDEMKYVIIECDAGIAKEIISNHVRDIYMGRRNFHYFLTNLIMDQFTGMKIDEFGAINITGFRILNRSSAYFRNFVNQWKSLDPFHWPGAGNKHVSVSNCRMESPESQPEG